LNYQDTNLKKYKTMYKGKDDLQIYLESVCHVQQWAKKHIAKSKQKVDVINAESISSVKQKLK
jgi:hypothetical protein